MLRSLFGITLIFAMALWGEIPVLGQSASQDAKNGAKSEARATKKTAKAGKNKTKKGINKSAGATEKEAGKLKRKTE